MLGGGSPIAEHWNVTVLPVTTVCDSSNGSNAGTPKNERKENRKWKKMKYKERGKNDTCQRKVQERERENERETETETERDRDREMRRRQKAR